MTNDEIRIAVAEHVGWRWCEFSGDKLTNRNAYWYPPNSVTKPPFREPQNMAHLSQLPKYESDLNAQFAAWKTLSDGQRLTFRCVSNQIQQREKDKGRFLWLEEIVAEFFGEIFLRTLNLWKE